MDKSQVAIEVKNLHKSFKDGLSRTEVLKSVSLKSYLGELLMIVGPSGCGKTTLLSCMATTLEIDEGSIECLGQMLHLLSEKEKLAFRAQNIGFIFQQFNLIPTLDVVENVSIPLLLLGQDEKQAQQRSAEILAEVGLAEKLKLRPTQLSGGQQQRVAIARALVHEPRLIICDEPTSALDSKTGVVIVELLQSLAKQKNRSVIIVTHDNRIFNFADRCVTMEDGKVVQVT